MRIIGRSFALVSLVLVLSAAALPQQSDLRIRETRLELTGVPGQIVVLLVEGVSEKQTQSLPAERFDVLISQDGSSYRGRVRSATLMPLAPDQPVSPPRDSPGTSTQMMVWQMRSGCRLLVTLPQGLSPGPATLSVTYDGKRSQDFNFRVLEVPPRPRIAGNILSYSRSSGAPGAELVNSQREDVIVRPGRNLDLHILPQIDTSMPDVEMLVTFKQGNSSHEVPATLIQNEAGAEVQGKLSVDGRFSLRAPDELTEGPVEIEVRLRVNGKTSDPARIRGAVKTGLTSTSG
jgi:hypothetical protein